MFPSPGFVHKTALRPESINALQEAAEPVQRRWTDKVVQELDGETRVVALASSPPLTDELWPFTGHEMTK
jgi:hypothetical protein